MESLLRELRYAFRTLARRPGFTTVAVLTLALGVGANTAVFSVFRSVVLRPLPYPEPDRLVTLDETFEGAAGFADGTPIWASWRSYLAWRDGSSAFTGIAAMASGRSTLELGDAARQVSSARVTASYFSVLGVEPILGRVFTEEETRTAAASVVILSEGLWRQAFAMDPDVLGRSVEVHGEARTVVGVLPDGYRSSYTGARQLWTPLYIDEARWLDSDARWLRVVGRLAEGRTTTEATRELVDIQSRLAADFPDTHGSKGAVVRGLHDVLVRNVDARLRLLLAAVGLVLVIAAINVAGLLLARALERSDEWRLRMALGAGRARLLRTNLVESLTLAAIGGLVGVGLARVGVVLLTRIEGGTLPPGASVSLDGPALAYAALVTVGAGLLFSAAPAWGLARRPPSSVRGGQTSTAGVAREVLVVAESALAVVVLVALGLALRSYGVLIQQDPGFEPDGMVTFRAPLPAGRYPTPESERTFHAALRSALLEVPGVEAAGAIEALPLERGAIWPVFIDGLPLPPPGQEPQVSHRFVTPGTFASLGVALLSGRDFTEMEFADRADVLIVDRLFAERFWPGQDPIGRQLRHTRDGPWLRVIGVVGATAQRGLEAGLLPVTYAPRTEDEMHVVVRSAQRPAELIPALRAAVEAVDPGVPMDEVRSGAMVVAGDTAGRRFDWMLLLAFAGVGLTLSAIGTYGSLSALVLRRRSEIGIRRALGASGRSVVLRVLGRTLALASLGLGLGFGMSIALVRVMEGLVYAIPATDPLTYLGVAALTLAAATLAGVAPARRAAAVSPIEAIRREAP